jgi:hypothetical protein
MPWVWRWRQGIRGLHSSTSQLNLNLHPKHPLITPETSKTPLLNPSMHPLSHRKHLR